MKIATVTPSKRPAFWGYLFGNIFLQETKPNYSILIIDEDEKQSTISLEISLRNHGIEPIIMRNNTRNNNLGNLFNLGFNEASRLVEEGLICLMTDDDFYDKKYLSEAAIAYKEEPWTAVIAKHQVRIRWVYGGHDPVLPDKGQELPNIGIGGGTFCVNSKVWRMNPDFRFDKNDPFGDTSLMEAIKRNNLTIKYTSIENFWHQRWGKDHNHAWKWSEDPQ